MALDHLPVGIPGGVGGQGVAAVARPLGHRPAVCDLAIIAGIAKIQELAVGVVVGRGHHAARAVDADHVDDAAVGGGAIAQVVVGQEEQMMAQLMGKGPPPVAPQVGPALAERIPHRPHADRARPVRVLDQDAIAVCFIQRALHDAAHAGARPHPVVGVDLHVRGQPLLLVLEHAHPAQRHLAVRQIVQHLRRALERLFQLQEEIGIAGRVPLQRDVQVEQQQGVVRRHNKLSQQGVTGSRRRGDGGADGLGAGVEQRVGSGDGAGAGDGQQRDQSVAGADLAAALQVAVHIGAIRTLAAAQRLSAGHLAGRQAEDQRAGHGLPAGLVHDPHLPAAHRKWPGGCAGCAHVLVGCRLIWLRRRPGGRGQTQHHVVAAPHQPIGRGVPRKDVLAAGKG